MNSYEFHLTVSHLLMGLCLLALSFFVYLKNRKNSLNITFSIYTFCIAWWSIVSILLIHAPNEKLATMWDRICLYGAIFIPATFIHFTFTFLGIAKEKRLTIHIYYLLSLLFAILNTSPLFIVGTEPIYKLKFFTKPGPFYYVYCLCFLFAEIHGFIYLFLSINSSKNDNEKLQRIYLLSATVLGVIGGSQNFNLALRTNIYFTAPWGNHLISLYAILVTYAILKHQLMDIRVVIKNSIIYSLLVTIISLIFIASVIILERLFQNFLGYKTIIGSTLSALFIGLIFTPLRNRIQNLVDYLFFKGSQLEIAEQNRLLRKEISNTEKFKSVATLASGIAHEIKNPLTAIKTFSEHLDEKGHDPEFLNRFAIIVRKEVDRIDEMVHQLLDFAKPAPPKLADTAINKLLEDTLNFLSNQLIQHQIQVEQDLTASKGLIIQADHNQLKQVFLNLFLNAIDAMPQGGTLTVNTAINDKHQLEIIVADTGVGIAKKDLAHIFDPFFSKKETGTGLGLAICFGIIKEHKGTIKVESVVEQGTKFIVQLPKEISS